MGESSYIAGQGIIEVVHAAIDEVGREDLILGPEG